MLLCSCLTGVPVAAADDLSARIGVNRVNLAWLSRSEQETVLKQIAASGVTDVRLSLSRPVEKSIWALETAHRLGLRILLEIQLGNKSYYPPQARPRTGYGRLWDVLSLSDLDPDLYRTKLRAALHEIDGLGIRLEAVEPGNEINFSAYNGDLKVYPQPGAATPRSVDALADRSGFERGLKTYVEAVRITREEVRATVHSRNAVIVSAGLSDITAEQADRRGLERLDPGEVVRLLRERGLDEVVDAYGIHLYPGRKSVRALEARVADVLEFCQPEETGKPCWITEWGIANTARACPVDDSGREGPVRTMRAAFDQLIEAGRLQAAFYYDWDTEARYGLWRCGGLSAAGEAAIAPE
ncbi:glycoside hydrolase [Nitratireductor sp. ZSWI3]|uniref:glycoside hydrolase n=1 Tax=Nitratireductor sp. ZSWI3 TaxID=2966359 RepID=UPI0021502E74|nr:glycoside hydrolase [Nitratireductor sp. ZSWI3]MCR4266040.1 glycoside hydrolase [Nitratireductor sp. ZSWI3]